MPVLRLRSGQAPAGIQGEQAVACGYSAWIPAFAGMTQHSSTPQNHPDRLLGARHLLPSLSQLSVSVRLVQPAAALAAKCCRSAALAARDLSARRTPACACRRENFSALIQ